MQKPAKISRRPSKTKKLGGPIVRKKFVYRAPARRHLRIKLLIAESILEAGRKPSDNDIASLLDAFAKFENPPPLSPPLLAWLAVRVRKKRYTNKGVSFAMAIEWLEIVTFIDKIKRRSRKDNAKLTYSKAITLAAQQFGVSTKVVEAVYAKRPKATGEDW